MGPCAGAGVRYRSGGPRGGPGHAPGGVRALVSDPGAAPAEAAPSTPVEILGFNGTPEAGDRLAVVENEARAREVTEDRARHKRDKLAAPGRGRGGVLGG